MESLYFAGALSEVGIAIGKSLKVGVTNVCLKFVPDSEYTAERTYTDGKKVTSKHCVLLPKKGKGVSIPYDDKVEFHTTSIANCYLTIGCHYELELAEECAYALFDVTIQDDSKTYSVTAIRMV